MATALVRDRVVVCPLPVFVFHGFQINILANLSIIYQYFSRDPLNMILYVPGMSNIAIQNCYFRSSLSRPVVKDHRMSLRSNHPHDLTARPLRGEGD